MMTTEEYRKHPSLNFSLAKHLLDSPAHFKAAQDEEFEPSEAMMLGTITHALVLEGKNAMQDYALKPDGMSFATKEGKAWRDAQTKPIIAEKKALKIPMASHEIAKNPYAAQLLKLCNNRESSFKVEYRGVTIKGLIDCYGVTEHGIIIADFKTCADASYDAFSRAIFDRHYDLQAAWYQTGLALALGLDEAPRWYWLACELTEPFANEVYLQSDEVYANGMAKMNYVIDEYKKCQASGKWDLPAKAPRTIEMKPWNIFNYESENS